MSERIEARVEETDDGWRVCSPGVGVWSHLPEPGALVGSAGAIGVLTRLRRRATLVLPAGIEGRVSIPDHGSRRVPVGFGDELLRLERAVGSGESADTRMSRGAAASGAGALTLLAPTDGIFYTRPAPDAAPFVSVGERVHTGQPVGLVEVMKTFNQILYEGLGLPAEAVVEEVRVGDGQEVATGDVLLVLRPG